MASNFPVSAQWDPALRTTSVRLTSIGETLLRVVRAGLRRTAELMAEDLRDLTPRSAGPGEHVADGWDAVETEVPGTDFAIEVRNGDPRFDEAIKVSTGGQTSLGLILEYGSAPHRIEAQPGKSLSFYWPAVGAVVHAKSVEHPGTRPYGMMAVATDKALDRAERLIAAAQKVIAEKFK